MVGPYVPVWSFPALRLPDLKSKSWSRTQKSSLAIMFPEAEMWSHMVQYCIWSCMVLHDHTDPYGLFCPMGSLLVQYGSLLSCMAPYGPTCSNTGFRKLKV